MADFDEIIGAAMKHQLELTRIVGDLLTAEILEKQERSIHCHFTISKQPLAKDIDDFAFDGTPINGTLVRDLAGGNFVTHQRNDVLVNGRGTGKTHLAMAIVKSWIGGGVRGRYFNVVDRLNRLEVEGRPGRIAKYLSQMDFVVQDKLGSLPFAQSIGQPLFHLISRLAMLSTITPTVA